VALALGCSTLVGVEDVSPNKALGAPVFLDPDAGLAENKCAFARDCAEITTTPAGCATAICVAGSCVYHASDSDQDGHPTARCAATDGTAIEAGDDCDDADPQLFPGHPAECAQTESGATITFPNGQPVGACKFGKRTCKPDGTGTTCVGAVGPKAVTSCTPDVDEACTGNPLEGCTCSAGQTTPCGTSATGACKKGTSTCLANNTFGPCTGAVEPAPRDCASTADKDCNGTIDAQETACQCTGGVAPGTKRACNTHLGHDGLGLCKAGSQTCAPSGGGSAWTTCSGDVGPTTEKCDGLDHDCNGTISTNEPSPPPPAGTTNCAKTYLCAAADRGPMYYRTDIGWTFYSGGGTLWTGYALDGAHAGAVPLARDSATGKNLGALNGTCGGVTLNETMSTFYTLP
jgi:hypothetical protein